MCISRSNGALFDVCNLGSTINVSYAENGKNIVFSAVFVTTWLTAGPRSLENYGRRMFCNRLFKVSSIKLVNKSPSVISPILIFIRLHDKGSGDQNKYCSTSFLTELGFAPGTYLFTSWLII